MKVGEIAPTHVEFKERIWAFLPGTIFVKIVLHYKVPGQFTDEHFRFTPVAEVIQESALNAFAIGFR